MKNILAKGALVLGGVVGTTHAQSPVNPLQDTTRSAVADVTFPGENVSVGIHNSDMWGSGASFSIQAGGEIDNHDFRFHGDVKVLQYAQDVFLSAGVKLTDNLILSGGYSERQENAGIALQNNDFNNANIRAHNGFVRLDFSGMSDKMQLALSYIYASATDTHLDTRESTSVLIRTEDLPAIIRRIQETNRTITTRDFRGGNSREILADAEILVGKDGYLTLRFGALEENILGDTASHVVGGVGYTHIFSPRDRVNASYDTMGNIERFSFRYDRILTSSLEGYIGASRLSLPNGQNDPSVEIGARWNFGHAQARYARPNPAEFDLDQTMRGISENAHYRLQSVAAMGEVVQNKSSVVTSQEVGRISKTPNALTNVQAVLQSDRSVVLTFDAPNQIPGTTYTCSVNGGAPVSCMSGTVFRNVSEGMNEIVITGTNSMAQPSASGVVGRVSVDNPRLDTTPPVQLSPTHLGNVVLGNNLVSVVQFDEPVANASVSGLPAGVTAMTSISGKDVTITFTVNPLVYQFTNATDTISLQLIAADANENSANHTEQVSITDVAPIFAPKADVSYYDVAGGEVIAPLTEVCPPVGSVDQLGRAVVSCTVDVTLEDGGVAFGELTYNSATNNVEGRVDVSTPTARWNVKRTIHVAGSSLPNVTNSKITLEDIG